MGGGLPPTRPSSRLSNLWVPWEPTHWGVGPRPIGLVMVENAQVGVGPKAQGPWHPWGEIHSREARWGVGIPPTISLVILPDGPHILGLDYGHSEGPITIVLYRFLPIFHASGGCFMCAGAYRFSANTKKSEFSCVDCNACSTRTPLRSSTDANLARGKKGIMSMPRNH